MSTFPALYIPSRPRIFTAAEYARQKLQQASNAAIDRAKRLRAACGTLFAGGRFVNSGGRVVNTGGQIAGDTADCGSCPCGSAGCNCPGIVGDPATSTWLVTLSGYTGTGLCQDCGLGFSGKTIGSLDGVSFCIPYLSSCTWEGFVDVTGFTFQEFGDAFCTTGSGIYDRVGASVHAVGDGSAEFHAELIDSSGSLAPIGLVTLTASCDAITIGGSFDSLCGAFTTSPPGSITFSPNAC